MYPAVRFDRFRRFEHQVSWPYLGKKAIKPACRTAIVNSSAFTNPLQGCHSTPHQESTQSPSPLFRFGRPLAAPTFFCFKRAFTRLYHWCLSPEPPLGTDPDASCANSPLLKPHAQSLRRHTLRFSQTRVLMAQPPATPLSKVQMVSPQSSRQAQCRQPKTELCGFSHRPHPRSCTLLTNSRYRRLT